MRLIIAIVAIWYLLAGSVAATDCYTWCCNYDYFNKQCIEWCTKCN